MPKELVPVNEEEYVDDLEYVRQNQRVLIEKGNDGLDELMNVAEQSQHPRSYEVLSAYLRTMSELNRELAITAEKKKDANIPQKGPDHVTNQLFVGSTKDLQELLKKRTE
jgi:hypothetical protein